MSLLSCGCTLSVDLDDLQGGTAKDEIRDGTGGVENVDPPDDDPIDDPNDDPQDDPLPTETACADSPLAGNWMLDNIAFNDTMTLGSDCHGTRSLCGHSFEYQPVLALAGLVQIFITQSNNPLCDSSIGTKLCTYDIDGDRMWFDCGDAFTSYVRNPF